MDDNKPEQASPGPINAQNITQMVYVLQAVGFFIGVTWLIAIVVNT